MENGVHQKQVHCTSDPPVRSNILGEKPALVAFLLYIQLNFTCVSRLLYRHNIKLLAYTHQDLHCCSCCAGWPRCEDSRRVQRLFWVLSFVHCLDCPMRRDEGEKTLPAYSAWTAWQLAEYLLNQDHHIQLQDTKIFSTKPSCLDQFIRTRTGIMAWSCMGHGNFSFSPSGGIGVISKVVKMLTALFRTNVCVLHPRMPCVHPTSSIPHLEPPIFLVGILWCPYHPTPSVLLTFLLHPCPMTALCIAPIFYNFHPFHYYTIIITTLLDLYLLAHLLLATAQHSSPSSYM